MNQPKETDPKPAESERDDGQGNFYTGAESFFGVFTQSQVYLNGVRLVHDGKVTQQVSDLASQIENNRRGFLHSGDIKFALQELFRITNSFNHRVQAWETQANLRENNKRNMSGGALAKMKSELSMVRTKIRLASRMLTKLEVELHQIAGRSQSQSAVQHQTGGTIDNQPGLLPIVASAAAIEKQQPVLSIQEQARAAECLRNVNLFLQRLVGKSLLVSYENADLKVTGDPNRVEQAWDVQAAFEIPIFLVAGWTVKHPDNPTHLGEMNLERKKLDLCFWLIPKSLNASKALRFIDGQTKLWISSRQLDSARITFEIASATEFPKSELVSSFLGKFANKYHGELPSLLVAHLQNLEWIQKTVIASCLEKQD